MGHTQLFSRLHNSLPLQSSSTFLSAGGLGKRLNVRQEVQGHERAQGACTKACRQANTAERSDDRANPTAQALPPPPAQTRGRVVSVQVWATKRAFPDLQIHVTDVFCVGNDIDGYKTTMPDVLIGTNTGPSSFGPPTGRHVSYNGMAVCYVQKVGGKWQCCQRVI